MGIEIYCIYSCETPTGMEEGRRGGEMEWKSGQKSGQKTEKVWRVGRIGESYQHPKSWDEMYHDCKVSEHFKLFYSAFSYLLVSESHI